MVNLALRLGAISFFVVAFVFLLRFCCFHYGSFACLVAFLDQIENLPLLCWISKAKNLAQFIHKWTTMTSCSNLRYLNSSTHQSHDAAHQHMDSSPDNHNLALNHLSVYHHCFALLIRPFFSWRLSFFDMKYFMAYHWYLTNPVSVWVWCCCALPFPIIFSSIFRLVHFVVGVGFLALVAFALSCTGLIGSNSRCRSLVAARCRFASLIVFLSRLRHLATSSANSLHLLPHSGLYTPSSASNSMVNCWTCASPAPSTPPQIASDSHDKS